MGLGTNGGTGAPTSVIAGNVDRGQPQSITSRCQTAHPARTIYEQLHRHQCRSQPRTFGSTGEGIDGPRTRPTIRLAGLVLNSNDIEDMIERPTDTTPFQGGSGIVLQGSGCTGNVIKSNFIASNASFGVLIEDGASQNLISNVNYIVKNITGVYITGTGTSLNIVEG